MSTEDLLLPRYKVIADYPYNNYHKIGSVLTDDGIQCVRDENGKSVFAVDFIKFPHIFKKLEWWEERKEDDMPEYLRFKTSIKIRKVEKYHLSIDQIVFEGGRTRRLNKDWHPATLEEYNEYQKQNQ